MGRKPPRLSGGPPTALEGRLARAGATWTWTVLATLGWTLFGLAAHHDGDFDWLILLLAATSWTARWTWRWSLGRRLPRDAGGGK